MKNIKVKKKLVQMSLAPVIKKKVVKKKKAKKKVVKKPVVVAIPIGTGSIVGASTSAVITKTPSAETKVTSAAPITPRKIVVAQSSATNKPGMLKEQPVALSVTSKQRFMSNIPDKKTNVFVDLFRRFWLN